MVQATRIFGQFCALAAAWEEMGLAGQGDQGLLAAVTGMDCPEANSISGLLWAQRQGRSTRNELGV